MAVTRLSILVTLFIFVVAGCTSTVCDGFVAGNETFLDSKAQYLRILISDGSNVFFRFQGSEMQLSTSEEGLESAPVVRAVAASPLGHDGRRYAQFPEVELPVPTQVLPSRTDKITATFRYEIPATPRERAIIGGLKFYRYEEDGLEWACLQKVRIQPRNSPSNARIVRGIKPADMRLEGVARVATGRVELAVRLMVEEVELSGIQRDSEFVNLKVCIRDRRGKELECSEGPLSDFGFG